MSWSDRSGLTLYPLSIEKRRLSVALQEWLYNGDMFDLEAPVETCELCGHPDIRYQFKIVNRHNGNELLVGSECINKFGIAATDQLGNVLDAAQSRKKVNRDRRHLVTEASKRRQIAALVELAGAETEFDINSFIEYVQERGAFTPSQLSLLAWKLKTHCIEHRPGDFKLVMKRDREKKQLLGLPDWKVKQLLPYLSSSQRAWVREHRGGPGGE